jgi:hypothetical protein
MTRLRSRGVELLCFAGGATILAVILWRVGLESLVRDLRLIGWGLGAILLVESANVVLNTCGWALAFPPGERPVSIRRLLAARLAGDGVNYLTPSATVGGEFLRIRLLGHDAPASLRWASVSVAKIGQTAAQAAFILLGLGLVLPRLTGASGWVGWIAGGGAAILAGLAFVRLVRRGIWATLETVMRRTGLRRLLPASWETPGRELDAAARRVGPRRVVLSLGCFVLAWAVGAAEIYVILRWVGDAVDWQTALAVETGSVLIDGILFFVPAKVGTQEGGKVVLFAALGLSPARGLTVGIVRRIRELTYAGLGLVALGGLSARPTAGPAGRPAPASSGERRPFRA